MVVDDNRDSADSATSIVRLLGYRVETAYDGASALELARSLRPQAVLLDLAMPQIDGYETLRLLRVQPGMETAYVIAMTGFGAEEDKRRTKADRLRRPPGQAGRPGPADRRADRGA
jgi:CheY-like chemotaxis protein